MGQWIVLGSVLLLVLLAVPTGYGIAIRAKDEGREATLVTHPFAGTGEPRFVFVHLPGTGCSGEITVASYLDLLTKVGPVLSLNYALWGFDYGQIRELIFAGIRESGLRPVFLGESLGSRIELDLMIGYMHLARQSRSGLKPIAGYWSDCGFVDADDIRPLAAIRWLAKYLPANAFTHGLVTAILLLAEPFNKRQRSLGHGDSEDLYRRHRRFCNTFAWAGYRSQLRYILQLQGFVHAMFAGIPAMLLHVDDDVLVNEKTARPRLKALFTTVWTEQVPGIHANPVEVPGPRRELLQRFIDLITAS